MLSGFDPQHHKRNHHFATILVTIDLGRNLQWMLKVVNKQSKMSKIFKASKYLPPNYLLVT
jgi:hypothetical protein